MGYHRNIFWFSVRSYSIYSRMAVGLDNYLVISFCGPLTYVILNLYWEYVTITVVVSEATTVGILGHMS